MKIRLLSDLHMEGYPFEYKYQGEDLVVLAGDIHTKGRHADILSQIPLSIRVLFVAGNHEYYKQEFHQTQDQFLELELIFPNFRWLNNASFKINDVAFFGGTMFTDFTLDGKANQPIAKIMASEGINDFYVMSIMDYGCEPRRWNVNDHESEYENFVREFNTWVGSLDPNQKRCVITHFSPLPAAINPRFKGSPLNPYFTQDMTSCMGYDGLWLYGHTHDSVDAMVGNTRVVSNPKGYGKENFNFDPDLIIEL